MGPNEYDGMLFEQLNAEAAGVAAQLRAQINAVSENPYVTGTLTTAASLLVLTLAFGALPEFGAFALIVYTMGAAGLVTVLGTKLTVAAAERLGMKPLSEEEKANLDLALELGGNPVVLVSGIAGTVAAGNQKGTEFGVELGKLLSGITALSIGAKAAASSKSDYGVDLFAGSVDLLKVHVSVLEEGPGTSLEGRHLSVSGAPSQTSTGPNGVNERAREAAALASLRAAQAQLEDAERAERERVEAAKREQEAREKAEREELARRQKLANDLQAVKDMQGKLASAEKEKAAQADAAAAAAANAAAQQAAQAAAQAARDAAAAADNAAAQFGLWGDSVQAAHDDSSAYLGPATESNFNNNGGDGGSDVPMLP